MICKSKMLVKNFKTKYRSSLISVAESVCRKHLREASAGSICRKRLQEDWRWAKERFAMVHELSILDPVVQREDNIIQRITHYPEDKYLFKKKYCIIQRIEIYPDLSILWTTGAWLVRGDRTCHFDKNWCVIEMIKALLWFVKSNGTCHFNTNQLVPKHLCESLLASYDIQSTLLPKTQP